VTSVAIQIPEDPTMPTVFSRIIAGELPGRFVWRDPDVVAFLTINPIRPGHTLIVPRREVDHWIDMDPALNAKVFGVSHRVAKGVAAAFPSTKVGVIVAGLEVPHVHVHVIPMDDMRDLDFARQERNPDPRALDDAASRLRAALTSLGFAEASA
jgi:diadenosine tetraphosphate (Ap4A) HIT family hydrolase